MRPGLWIRFQSFFLNLTIFYLDDFVFVADMWAGSLLENVVDSDMIGNLVTLVETGLMRLSRILM